MSTHPSFLALDQHALGVESSALREHLATCDVCEAHVKKVAAGANYPVGLVAKRKTKPWLYGIFALASMASLGVALAVGLQTQEHLRTKGVPGVAIFVKRGDDVFLWKQSDPLRQGDRIRLNVDGHGLGYVRIVSERGDALYEGELTPDKAALPLSWRIEGNSAQERFIVLLSKTKDSEPVERIPVVINVEGYP